MPTQKLITVSLHPIFWGVWALIGTITVLDMLSGHLAIALWIVLGAMAIISCLSFAQPRTGQVKVVLLVSIIIATAQYTVQKHSFDSFYTHHTIQDSPLIGLVEDVSITQLVEDDVAFPYMLKVLTYIPGDGRRLLLTVPLRYAYTHIRAGECVTIPAHRYRKAKNSGFNRYLLKSSIQASVFLTTPPRRAHCPHMSLPLRLKQRLLVEKERLFGAVQRTFSKPTAYMVSVVFLGKQPFAHEQTSGIRNEFATWGVVHFVVRAGLHLMVLFSVLAFLIGLLGLAPLTKKIVLMLFVYWYALMSWASLPFARALVSATLTSYAFTRGFLTRPLDAISITAYCFIALNPFIIFFLDFQLSFGVTAILCWLTELKSARTVAPHP